MYILVPGKFLSRSSYVDLSVSMSAGSGMEFEGVDLEENSTHVSNLRLQPQNSECW